MTRQRNHDRNFLHPSKADLAKLHAAVLNSDLRQWLQSKGAERGGRQRIETLIESCVSLAQLAPQANVDLLFDESVDKRGRAYLENSARLEECQQLADTINRLLRRYKATQTIVEVNRGVSIEWIADCPDRSDAATESHIAHQIMHRLQEGDLAKLRKCECGRYFFARTSISRFCSEKCRGTYWESSEVRKEQKRKKAKEYYHLHKKKNTK